MAEPGSKAPLPPRSPFRAVTTGTRKGIHNLVVLILCTSFGVALAAAAYTGRLPWKEAFTLGAFALGVFGVHSGVTSHGIATEDAASKKRGES